MAWTIDQEVLHGFVEEAQQYLPRIRRALGSRASGGHSEWEEAHRLLHSIKGAASMIGLNALSHIASFAEELVEEVSTGERGQDAEVEELLATTVAALEHYLGSVEGGVVHDREQLSDLLAAYRRLRGLPAAGDEAALASLLAAGPSVEDDFAVPPVPAGDARAFSPAESDSATDELIEAFREEAEEHLRIVSALLREYERQPQRTHLQAIRRSVHTLKGTAAMVGYAAVGGLAHRMEDLLDRLYDGDAAVTPPALALLHDTTDALADLLASEPATAAPDGLLSALLARYGEELGAEPAPFPPPTAVESPGALGEEGSFDLEMPTAAAGEAGAPASPADQPSVTEPSDVIRVPLARLDELVRLLSELVVHRSTLEQHYGSLVRQVGELDLSLSRLHGISGRLEGDYEASALSSGQAGHPRLPWQPSPRAVARGNGGGEGVGEFDELELDRYSEYHLLTRALGETANDIGAAGSELTTTSGDFAGDLTRQARLTSELQDKLMRLRMVPLSTLATRLHRTARVTGSRQGKAVDLTLEGEAVELDKSVVEALAGPLLHMIRNAVDHGIEPPALRHVLGKPERGQVRIRARHEGTEVAIEVTDDGAGLDLVALRDAAVANGHVAPADAAELSDDQIRELVFLPGLSTAGEVTEVSGRGVGLDVVKSRIVELKGSITVSSVPGEGVRFSIRLPLTLAIIRVLLVRANGELLAVPFGAVTRIQRVDPAAIEQVGNEQLIRLDGRVRPVIRLGKALRIPQPPDESVRRPPALVLNLGERQVALLVDHLVEVREVVVKRLGTLLPHVGGVSGATLMGDGSVVLIVNPGDLLRDTLTTRTESRPALAAAPRPRPLEVLIVDDSLSVRRLLTNLATASGWNPITARDGVEALEVLQGAPRPPDAILLDIEMPRMDGYELTATLRAQDRFSGIPIIMITSRSGQKHRERAFDLGASEYLVKPYQPESLVSVVQRLVRTTRAAGEQATPR